MVPNINTDYEHLWDAIALRHTPPGPSGDCVAPRGQPWNGVWVKSFIVTRSVYYTGTCSGQAAIQSATTAIRATNMFASAGNSVPVIGGAISGIASIIASIFQHHAQAVVNEQQAECAVKQITQQAIPAIDAAVANGQISAQQGIAAHLQVVQQCKQILAPVAGVGSSGHPCNAGCCFGYFLDCLQDFAETYYMDLTPLLPASATPPQTYAPIIPQSIGHAQLDMLYPPPGSPGALAGSISIGTGTLLLAFVAFAVAVILIRRREEKHLEKSYH